MALFMAHNLDVNKEKFLYILGRDNSNVPDISVIRNKIFWWNFSEMKRIDLKVSEENNRTRWMVSPAGIEPATSP